MLINFFLTINYCNKYKLIILKILFSKIGPQKAGDVEKVELANATRVLLSGGEGGEGRPERAVADFDSGGEPTRMPLLPASLQRERPRPPRAHLPEADRQESARRKFEKILKN